MGKIPTGRDFFIDNKAKKCYDCAVRFAVVEWKELIEIENRRDRRMSDNRPHYFNVGRKVRTLTPPSGGVVG